MEAADFEWLLLALCLAGRDAGIGAASLALRLVRPVMPMSTSALAALRDPDLSTYSSSFMCTLLLSGSHQEHKCRIRTRRLSQVGNETS